MNTPTSSLRFLFALLLGLFVTPFPVASAPANAATTVYIEEMTSPELRERIAAGSTTVLVPIGGTEQNGPHMVLGKHNVRVRVLAGRIAQQLGNAVVAPVLAYVPEGSIHPPSAHMRFTGTISIPVPAFESVLESTARSFKEHGFHTVIFLGDHGGYQKTLTGVATRLDRSWNSDPSCRVYALTEYYQASQSLFDDDLKARGFSEAAIGTHAGLADTSLALAIDRSLVRVDKLSNGKKPDPAEGVYGDPREAREDLGQIGIKRIVDASVTAIRKLVRSPE